MNAYLIINTQIYPLTQAVTTIGRHLDNDLVIQVETISRKHAQVCLEGEHFYLYDLDSTGGTFLNSTKIDKAKLSTGDSILLAKTPIVFVQNAPQLAVRSAESTGSLHPPGPDTEPTVLEKDLEWRLEDQTWF
ncbi:MAG: FHA domain-containing protein [Anaerolineae bacterium]|nr:FHA domain-containing protein [Anaerolineae bacterium]